MFSEKDFCGWLSQANPEVLKRMVSHNESLIDYAKQFPGVISIVRLAKPFIKYGMISLDTNKIMSFLAVNRPDIHAIVTREWVKKQVDDFKNKIEYF